MLSSILHSPRAVQVNIAIMRAFVQLRHVLGSHAELARKLAERAAIHPLGLADLATLLRDLLKVSISGNLLNAAVGQQYDDTIGQLTRSQHCLRRSLVGAPVENHPAPGKSLILFPSQIAG